MLYPKNVIEFVKSRPELSSKFGEIVNNLNITLQPLGKDQSFLFEEWMFREGHKISPAIRRYTAYLCKMRSSMEVVNRFFVRDNPGRKDQKDAFQVMTSAEQMFYIANAAYILDSYGIQGDLLECGSFKGFSSCCLSWACDFLGKKLIVADSFQGLPPAQFEHESGYYSEQDFKGDFLEVKENIETLGKIQSVEFIKGFYSESLKGFNRPLSLLWLDVDLYSSAKDVLTHAYSSLAQGGLIFSDEIPTAEVAENGQFIKNTPYVTKALKEYFKEKEISYHARHLLGYVGVIIPYSKHNPSILPAQYRRLWDLACTDTTALDMYLDLLHSRSYRLGRTMTAPYRLIKSQLVQKASH